MKAIVVKAAGGVDQLKLETSPIPECKPDEVLVNVKFAGINYIDIYFRKGQYKPSAYPFIPGKEGSGVITAMGKNVKHLKVGDRVAFCGGSSGSYAEYTTISADQVVLLPDSVSDEIAAAIMLQGLTAYYLSHETILLNEKHTVLVHAGAGGVGLLLIQMAKLRGARVITTVSNVEKAELAREAGADELIIYTQESFLEKVMQFTNNIGVHVVYDAVGATTFENSLKCLRLRGMLVSYGQASGPVPPLNLFQLSEKSLYLTRPVLFHYISTKDELNHMSNQLFNMISKDQLKITIGQRYALENVAKAHADLESRKTTGKSLLVLSD